MSEPFNDEKYCAEGEALSILSVAKDAALSLVLEAGHGYGRVFDALETYRWVANAYDHVHRAQRETMGLERRGDPCLPSW
jgi:hypothetical protein